METTYKINMIDFFSCSENCFYTTTSLSRNQHDEILAQSTQMEQHTLKMNAFTLISFGKVAMYNRQNERRGTSRSDLL